MKSWIQRLNIQGLRTDNALGHYPAMSLAEARTAAFERWKIAKGGGDPRREEAKAASPIFAEAAEAVIAIHEPSWRSPKSGPQWRASLETYAYPVIGELPVSEVMPGHVMAIVEPIWNEKRETARRVKQRISAICRWAVAPGLPDGRSGGDRDRRGVATEWGGTAAHAGAPLRRGGGLHRAG